ncbi:hypothetical protein [Ectobacillus ponti]|uniref:Uncharacterized protein n=1 Tax=Ectobacillus ponti TaxID=2961894 RepID=A0AA41XAR2_9BACI|nr:hypothetical protein [Ectobacillus ponti]MCP8970040.1 hypothetical protein [Ectobacillus ponti]
MSLLQEISSISGFISEKYPDAAVHEFQEPPGLESNLFVVQLREEVRRNETASSMLVERQYIITFYDSNVGQVMSTMAELSHYLLSEPIHIPTLEAGRLLKIDSFTLQSAVQADGDLLACTGVFATQFRELRRMEPAEKVGRVQIQTL